VVFIGIDQKQSDMIEILDKLLVTDDEFAEGPQVWKTYEDLFPEEFSAELHKKHEHIKSKNADVQEGWQDCLDQESDGEEEEV